MILRLRLDQSSKRHIILFRFINFDELMLVHLSMKSENNKNKGELIVSRFISRDNYDKCGLLILQLECFLFVQFKEHHHLNSHITDCKFYLGLHYNHNQINRQPHRHVYLRIAPLPIYVVSFKGSIT